VQALSLDTSLPDWFHPRGLKVRLLVRGDRNLNFVEMASTADYLRVEKRGRTARTCDSLFAGVFSIAPRNTQREGALCPRIGCISCFLTPIRMLLFTDKTGTFSGYVDMVPKLAELGRLSEMATIVITL